MKTLLIFILLGVNFSCNEKKSVSYCNMSFEDSTVDFVLHGGILDKYDEGRVYIGIFKTDNPHEWANMTYFTGSGFSKDINEEKKVLEKDSCELKELYFEYLNKIK